MIEATVLDIQDVQFKMNSGFLNWIMGMFQSKIVTSVKEGLADAKKEIDTMVKQLDDELNSGDPMKFMWNVLNDTQFPINMTMTQAPKFDHTTNLVEFHIDGLFYDSPQNTSHVIPNAVFPPRYESSHSEQAWIHETTLNSLFFAVD